MYRKIVTLHSQTFHKEYKNLNKFNLHVSEMHFAMQNAMDAKQQLSSEVNRIR